MTKNTEAILKSLIDAGAESSIILDFLKEAQTQEAEQNKNERIQKAEEKKAAELERLQRGSENTGEALNPAKEYPKFFLYKETQSGARKFDSDSNPVIDTIKYQAATDQAFMDWNLKAIKVGNIEGEIPQVCIYNTRTGLYEEAGDQGKGTAKTLYNLVMKKYGLLNVQPAQLKHLIERILATAQTEEHTATETSKADHLIFKNGILDKKTGELLPFSPDIIQRDRNPHIYDPEAEEKTSPEMRQLIEDVFIMGDAAGDPQTAKLLWQIIAYTLFGAGDKQEREIFFLVGTGHNGKSCFLNVLVNLIGRHETAFLDPRNTGDKFSLGSLLGKRLVCCGDIGTGFLEDISFIKQVSGGDGFSVEKKYKDPVIMKGDLAQAYCCNGLPQVKEKNEGIYSRFVTVPFLANFDKGSDNFVPDMEKKLESEEAIRYIIAKAFRIYQEFRAGGGVFERPAGVEQAGKSYELEASSAIQWLVEIGCMDEKTLKIENPNFIIGREAPAVYETYREWMKNEGGQPLSGQNFKKEIFRVFEKYAGLTLETPTGYIKTGTITDAPFSKPGETEDNTKRARVYKIAAS